MKKRIAVVAAFAAVCLAAMSFAFAGARKESAQAAEANYIDMYLIAGQSNAAGYSSYIDIAVDDRQTFENVMYAGETDRQIGTTNASSSFITGFASSVRVGLGASNSFIGPEYGMAEALNSLYDADNKAIIFKSAAGGTSLLNENSGNSASFGNWLPPSERGNYTENPATGVQYDVFMENFRLVYNTLRSQGYTPRIKGMAWMQGEQDRSSAAVYKTVIQSFIADVRSDLSDITGTDQTYMPFVMGEISETFSGYNERSLNQAFNTMLHQIPSLVPYTAVIASGKYAINYETGVVGTDRYHWSGSDMEEIGMLFAEEIVALSADGVRVNVEAEPAGSVSFIDGAIEYTYADGVVTFVPRPDDDCSFVSLTVNGTEIAEQNGQYTLEASGIIEIEAEFAPLPVYDITYEYDRSMGSLAQGQYNKARCVEGHTLQVRPSPKSGYEVASVTVDGTALAFDEAAGVYTSAPITADTTVVITFRAAETTDPVTPPDDTPADSGDGKGESGGCGCGGALAGTLALSAAALAVFVKKPF